MSQITTIFGTVQNVNSVNSTELNATVVAGRDGLRKRMRLDHGKSLCQVSQPHAAVRSSYPSASASPGWRSGSPATRSVLEPAVAGLELPSAAWASLVLTLPATRV